MRIARIIAFWALCVGCLLPIAAALVDVDSVCKLGLPVVWVETVDGVEPTCDYVSAPSGCIGGGITNTTKVPMRIQLLGAGDGEVLYDSGDYETDVSGATIRIRGNTSAYAAKKPFKVKLERKADLLLRGDDERYADKNWLLLYDDDLLSLFGLTVSRLMAMKWTPAATYVNVVVNGDYRGIYLLIEQVRRNRSCRLDCEKTGFVVELDPYWWNEPLSIKSLAFSNVYHYTFKYPEPEDLTESHLDYVTQVMNDFDRSIGKGTYPNHIDVASLAQWLVAHEVMGTWDSGGSNKYFVKRDDSDTTLLEMPVLWDFDSSLQMEGDWSRLHSDIFRRFFTNKNKELVKQWQHRWRTVSPWIVDSVKAAYSRFAGSEQGRGLDLSRPHDNARWGVAHPLVAVSRQKAEDWIEARKPWLDANVEAFYTDPHPAADVNEDGVVDVDDLNIVINIMLHKRVPFYRADVNCDMTVDIDDLNAVVNIIVPTTPIED